MEKIKIGDIDALTDKHDYKHAGLYDASGKAIVALNTNKTPLPTKLAQIKKRLAGIDQGFYTLRYQHNIGKKFPVYDYLIQIGDLSEAPNIIKPTANVQQQPIEQVRGWNEALADKEELARLRAENARLQHIEKSLEEEADEEEEEEEEPDALAQAGNTFKELAPQFLPYFDKFFEQRDRELSQKDRELTLRENRTPIQVNTANLKPKHPFRPLPAVESEGFTNYCNWLKEQADNIFDAELTYLQANSPAHFAVCKEIFLTDDQEE